MTAGWNLFLSTLLPSSTITWVALTLEDPLLYALEIGYVLIAITSIIHSEIYVIIYLIQVIDANNSPKAEIWNYKTFSNQWKTLCIAINLTSKIKQFSPSRLFERVEYGLEMCLKLPLSLVYCFYAWMSQPSKNNLNIHP